MNESDFLEELVNKYYEYIKDDEKVIVACTGYDNQAIPTPRLVNTVSFNNKTCYILACKRTDSIEIYRDFKYKGDAIPLKYGGCFVEDGKPIQAWSLKF
jgi:hypothetical protein